MLHVTQKRDCLQSLAQTHLISEDTIDVVLIEPNHPVETSHLVVSHGATLDVGRGLVELDHLGLGGVQVGEQLLVLLLLRHPVPAVPLLTRGRGLLLPACLHLVIARSE